MDLALSEAAETGTSAGWDQVYLTPRAVPEVSLGEVDLSTQLFGHDLESPVIIAGMTGGHEAAVSINRRLGELTERRGIAIGLGSQRAALLNPDLAPSYEVVRKAAPNALVVGNIGAAQLVDQESGPALSLEQIRTAVEMVEADALAVHLNVLEELIQTEGDRVSAGFLDAIAELCAELDVPVIAKETGSGIDRHSAGKLIEAGVAAIDVGGTGGTDFARIEAERASSMGDNRGERLGETFSGWGLPTAAAVLHCRGLGVPVIATGGIRSGLDAAKALALGADLVGVGRPFLSAAAVSEVELDEAFDLFIEELRVAMVVTGARSITEMGDVAKVLTRDMASWRDGLDT